MGKLYTLDKKLLTETTEVRVGETIYAVDNRQKTVLKIQKVSEEMTGTDVTPDMADAAMQEIMRLAVGPKAAKEIDDMNMPYPAYQKLFALLMAAVTGEDADEFDARFRQTQTAAR